MVEPRRAGHGDLGRLVAAADPDPRLRERLAATHGGVAALAGYDALLERRDLDAVLVFADNRTSAELGVRALQRGLPGDGGEADGGRSPGRGGAARRRAGRAAAPDGELADRLAACASPRAGPRARGRGGRARAGEPSGRPRRPARVRMLAAILRLALRSRAQRRRRPRRLLRIRSAAVSRAPRAAAGSHRRGGAPAQGGSSGGRQRHRRAPLSPRAGPPGGELDADRRRAGLRHDRLWRRGDAPGAPAPRDARGSARGRRPRRDRDRRGQHGRRSAAPSDDERDGPTYFLSCLRAGRPVEGLCAPDVGRDVQEVLGAALLSSRTGSAAWPFRPDLGPERARDALASAIIGAGRQRMLDRSLHREEHIARIERVSGRC